MCDIEAHVLFLLNAIPLFAIWYDTMIKVYQFYLYCI